MKALSLLPMLCLSLCSACVGTTGGDVVDFGATASGPEGLQSGSPLAFDTDLGWQVSLTTAHLHVGAVYLNESLPVSGAQSTNCILPGTYVAEVTDGLNVDLLSSEGQPFPSLGHGTTLLATSAQVWLTEGPIDSPEEPAQQPILTVVGSATRAGDVRPFSAKLSISTSNRLANSVNSPFASPICKLRVVSPIATSVQVETQGSLRLRIDPRLLFVNVDFGALMADSGVFVFADDSSDQPSANLYQNLRSAGALYTFSWASAPQ